MILNEDIHEFDKEEEKLNKKMHTLWEWIKRIPYLIDAMLFEKTYKDEYDYLVKENLILKNRLSDSNKRKRRAIQYSIKLARRIREMQKRNDKHEEKEI